LPRSGKPGEIEVLSMFASVLRKMEISVHRDDPYIEFEYNGRKWKVQHFYPRQRGVLIKGREHNADLVAWSDDECVAYVEVKDRSQDLDPSMAREFVGRVLWKRVDDALFVSKKSTINRWGILDRYGIRNTDHILEAKGKVEYREWPEIVVENFIKSDMGSCKVKAAFDRILPLRKGKAYELLKRRRDFDGVGFKFVEYLEDKTIRHFISDEDYVIHAPYCIFAKDSRTIIVFEKNSPVTLSDAYEVYASTMDLGADATIFISPEFQTESAHNLFRDMGFSTMSKSEINSKFGVNIDVLPVFKWEKSAVYPLVDLNGANEQNMPPCVKNALNGVPDGLHETATFLQTVFKACSTIFNEKDFAEKCWKKIEEFWLGFTPSKTKKDTFQKVSNGTSLAFRRNIDPASLFCNMDSLGVKGPKTLDKLFHLRLCNPDRICNTLSKNDIFEYIKCNLAGIHQMKLDA